MEVGKPTQGVVYVAKEYPPWQQVVLKTLREMYTQNNNTFPENKEIMNALKTNADVKKHMKKLMPFVAHLKVPIFLLCENDLYRLRHISFAPSLRLLLFEEKLL